MKQFNLDYLPDDPYSAYKHHGWAGWRDFYGNEYLLFEEARSFVRSLDLKTQEGWKEYSKSGKKPANIPANPYGVYKNKGWIDWIDWVGGDAINGKSREFLTFPEAREFVRSLNLKCRKDWWDYWQEHRLLDIPMSVDRIYKDEWISWGDFLGTGYIHTWQREYLSFKEAKKLVKELPCNGQLEYQKMAKKKLLPKGLPASPRLIYLRTGEWKGWDDWFGKEKSRYIEWLPFKEAKEQALILCKKYDINSCEKWQELHREKKIPRNIPTYPNEVYNKDKEWDGWHDFLGKDPTVRKKCIIFEKAKAFAIGLELKSCKEWKEYCDSGKKPFDIPFQPNRYYKDKGWINWSDFLGTNKRNSSSNRNFLTLENAKRFVRKLNIKNYAGWKECYKSGKIPSNIPAQPEMYYKNKGWVNWRHFLGAGHKVGRDFLSIEDAKKVVEKFSIKSCNEWFRFFQKVERPFNLPFNPRRYYKDKGWTNWPDFLGTKK